MQDASSASQCSTCHPYWDASEFVQQNGEQGLEPDLESLQIRVLSSMWLKTREKAEDCLNLPEKAKK